MIKGALFALVVFAVVWLAVWTMRAEKGKPRGATPFDMREPKLRPESAGPGTAPRRARAARTRRPR